MRIKQRNKSDCVVAAVAMVTRNSYAKVRRVWGGTVRGGIKVSDVLRLINRFGSFRRAKPRKKYTLEEWAGKHPNSVVAVIRPSGRGHAIAVVDGKVLDPATEFPDLDRLVFLGLIPD